MIPRIYIWNVYEANIYFTTFIFRKLFTCAVFTFNLSRRGTTPDIKILLLSNLQDITNSKIFYSVSTTPVFYLKSLVPQCRTINSGSFDIVGCMYEFMSSVVAPLKCFVTTILFSSDNSHSFSSFTIGSPKITTGSFFWHYFWLRGWFLLVFPVGCFWFSLSSKCNVSRDDSVACKSSLLFWLSSLTKSARNLLSWM